MLVLAIKLKAGVTAHHFESFIKKLVPDLQESRRIGSLSSMKMYSTAHTGVRLDEFVLMIDGFVQAPPMEGLEEVCDVVYSFECEETGSWGPRGPTTN
jgi:hypothetical protein